MHTVCNQSDLLAAVRHAEHGVTGQSSLPILSHLLLTCDGDTMTVTGHDLHRYAVAEVPATVIEPGRWAMPSRLLVEVAVVLDPNKPVQLRDNPEGREGELALQSGKFRLALYGLPADEFPPCPRPSELTAQVDGRALANLLRRVGWCSEGDRNGPPAMTGNVRLAVADGRCEVTVKGQYEYVWASLPATGAMEPVCVEFGDLRVIDAPDLQIGSFNDGGTFAMRAGGFAAGCRAMPEFTPLAADWFATEARLGEARFGASADRTSSKAAVAVADAIAKTAEIKHRRTAIGVDAAGNLVTQAAVGKSGSAYAEAEAEASGAGEVSLPSAKLRRLVQAIGGESLQLTAREGAVLARSTTEDLAIVMSACR